MERETPEQRRARYVTEEGEYYILNEDGSPWTPPGPPEATPAPAEAPQPSRPVSRGPGSLP